MDKPKAISAEDLKKFADTLPDNYLMCRRYGHNWVPRTAIKKKWWFEATVACDRCDCTRVEVINLRGEIVKKLMYYPKGYLAINLGRIIGESKNGLRLAALERHLAGTVTEEIEEEEEA